MEPKIEIKTLQELFDWINSSEECHVAEMDDTYFYIAAPNNSWLFVDLEEDDEIDDIISRTIERLKDFDADEQFMELWGDEFAERNHFKPSQFIKMLQEDEECFHRLEWQLREIHIKSLPYSKAV